METGLSIILIQAIHGLVYGMLLFLVASGLTLVFGMMDVLNIAHSGFYMLGAYIGIPTIIPADEITVPPAETGNPRCK
jgi:branched-subunit amino acid ABC-type transport system permease component